MISFTVRRLLSVCKSFEMRAHHILFFTFATCQWWNNEHHKITAAAFFGWDMWQHRVTPSSQTPAVRQGCSQDHLNWDKSHDQDQSVSRLRQEKVFEGLRPCQDQDRGRVRTSQEAEEPVENFSPLFDQDASGAGSEPGPTLEPVLCVSIVRGPIPSQGNWFQSDMKTLLL